VRLMGACRILVAGMLLACVLGCQFEPVLGTSATAAPAVATLGPTASPRQAIATASDRTAEPTASESPSPDQEVIAKATPSRAVLGPTVIISGTIGTLTIPALDRIIPVVSVGWHVDEIDGAQVAVWETVKNAAGHHRGSAPLGGEGNCVLSGHSSADQGGVFEGLWDLVQGDSLYLTDGAGQVHSYVVGSVTKVQEMGASLEERLAHAAAMDPTEDARLTLVTCWPDWAYTHRVIVVAQREGAG